MKKHELQTFKLNVKPRVDLDMYVATQETYAYI